MNSNETILIITKATVGSGARHITDRLSGIDDTSVGTLDFASVVGRRSSVVGRRPTSPKEIVAPPLLQDFPKQDQDLRLRRFGIIANKSRDPILIDARRRSSASASVSRTKVFGLIAIAFEIKLQLNASF